MLKETRTIGPCFSIFFFYLLFFYLFSDVTVRILGKGGEGTVYLARHKDTNIEYAMKEIFVKDAEDADKVKKIIETIRKLSSTYIVKYYNPIETSQNVYILMEYCRGDSLQELIKKRSDSPVEEVV
jgi:serine/threonine protein kinase